jgi:hypothetical protein
MDDDNVKLCQHWIVKSFSEYYYQDNYYQDEVDKCYKKRFLLIFMDASVDVKQFRGDRRNAWITAIQFLQHLDYIKSMITALRLFQDSNLVKWIIHQNYNSYFGITYIYFNII